MIIKCTRCEAEIPREDSYEFRGQPMCEDCYMGAMQGPKPCDVAAVHMARQHRTAAGQKGTAGLLEIQKSIFDYIKERNGATRQELAARFNLPDWELEKQIAVLRHCELIRGRRENNMVYLMPAEEQ